MDLDELRVILAIAETGSVLAASEKLRLTRTTLRRRLDALEARVGAPLVFRGPSGAALTEAGQVVARHARAIVQESNALLASAREVGEQASGVLRVALPVGMPPHAIALLYGTLRATQPKLAIDARFSEDPLQALDEVDLVLHFGARLTNGPWITRVVHDMREVLLASPDYLREHGTPRTPEDLRDHALILWRRPGEDPRELPLVAGGSFAVEPMAVGADVHTLRLLAANGSGIGFVPEGNIPDPMMPPEALVPVLTDFIGRDCPLRMAVPEPLAHAPKVRRVLENLTAWLQAT